MYNYYAVSDTNTKNVCPIDWYVPSSPEWAKLTAYLGGDGQAGGKIKEAGFSHWASPNLGAANQSGFSAIPVGFRFWNGTYAGKPEIGDFWTSTEFNATRGLYLFFHFGIIGNALYDDDKRLELSVRCLKN